MTCSGFEANVAHYHNSPVIDMPESYRPIVVNDDGSRVSLHHHHHRQQQDQEISLNLSCVNRQTCDEYFYNNFAALTPETSTGTPVRPCDGVGDYQYTNATVLSRPPPQHWTPSDRILNTGLRPQYYARAIRSVSHTYRRI